MAHYQRKLPAGCRFSRVMYSESAYVPFQQPAQQGFIDMSTKSHFPAECDDRYPIAVLVGQVRIRVDVDDLWLNSIPQQQLIGFIA